MYKSRVNDEFVSGERALNSANAEARCACACSRNRGIECRGDCYSVSRSRGKELAVRINSCSSSRSHRVSIGTLVEARYADRATSSVERLLRTLVTYVVPNSHRSYVIVDDEVLSA